MRVLHLVGSAESEFFADLSRLYAADCLDTTAGLHTAVIAYVTPDRMWRFPADLTPSAIAAAPPVPLSEAVGHIEHLRIDVMLPQMFCLPGMTTYRALFDALDIPYVGNPSDVMALGADKAKARAVVAAAGVDVPEGEVLRVGERSGMLPPVVVKPGGRRQLARHRPGPQPGGVPRGVGGGVRALRPGARGALCRAGPGGPLRRGRP